MTDRQPRPLDETPPWMEELLRRIDESADRHWAQQMESIGYDVSSPQARAKIREDHEWVRDWRGGSTKAKLIAMMMFWTAVLGGVGKLFWDGAAGSLQALLRAKGAGP